MKRLLILLCLMLGFSAPLSAQDKIVVDATNQTVRTPRGLYSIKELLVTASGDHDVHCIYRDKISLMCINHRSVSFGAPISLKDFNIIPIFSASYGNSTNFSETILLIENSSDVYFHLGIKSYCLNCGRIAKIDIAANEVDFIMGREDGKREFAAKFIEGKIVSGLRTNLDENEPLSVDHCGALFEIINEGCLEAKGGVCKNVTASFFGMRGRAIGEISKQYSAFPSDKFSKICDQICSTGKKVSRASFSKEICRR